jgi:hypothetical protein
MDRMVLNLILATTQAVAAVVGPRVEYERRQAISMNVLALSRTRIRFWRNVFVFATLGLGRMRQP